MLRGEGAENLIEEADLDGAGGAGAGLAAVFDACRGVEGVVELLAVDGDVVAEAARREACREDG